MKEKMFKAKNKRYVMSKIFLVAISFMTTAYGMEPLYSPIIQETSTQHDTLRVQLQRDDIAADQQWYNIVGYQKRGVCSDYAFTHILHITKPLKIVGGPSWFTELHALRFFKQIEKPQKNCLVVYTLDEKDFEAQHVGVVINDDKNNIQVRSKWGAHDPIIEHSLFTAPINYGKAAFFFALKEKHVNDKQCIVHKIQKSIDQSESMRELLSCFQHDFNRLAQGKKPLSCEFPVDNLTDVEMASIILKKSIGVNVNGLNEHNETPLISAIQKGNVDMVKLCIEYDADKNAQDMWDRSAIQLAREKGYEEIVQALRQKRIKRL